MTRQCLLDMDGVIVDFHRGVCRLFGIPQEKFDGAPRPLPWDWVWSFTGLTEEQFWSRITAEFWEQLLWTEDGPPILELVEAYFGKENVCLLTNPSERDHAVIGKMKWIRSRLPQYRNRVLFGAAKHFCASGDRVLIDDAWANVASYTRAGGQGLLVPRLWNQLHRVEQVVPYLEGQLRTLSSRR